MSYKPDEKDMMAYLYGELEGTEKEKIDQYLLQNPEARKEMDKFQKLRKMMSSVEDKEVIAPPIVIGDANQRFLWNAPYVKLISSIAASLLLIMLVGKLTGTQISFANREFKLSFGGGNAQPQIQNPNSLSADDVQQMINSSLAQNNDAMHVSLRESQDKLEASIKQNLAMNSGKINNLVRQASTASQDQIRLYVASLQENNIQLVKDYFQLTSTEQKKYVEDLLVDFAQYLQQQRNNDLQLVQTQLQSLEQNTNVFKQETEQILAGIITTVESNGTPAPTEIKN
jgi:hypothetical protein